MHVCLAVASALILAACRSHVDPAVDCSSLGKNFFESTRKVKQEFAAYAVNKQYVVYICGVQKVHPPIAELATLFANEGGVVAPFLLERMNETTSDATVMDILYIFERMQKNMSYSVARDDKLMSALALRIGRVSDPTLRDEGRQTLETIRTLR